MVYLCFESLGWEMLMEYIISAVTCFRSGMMTDMAPSVRNVSALATGSLEWSTVKILLRNSSTMVILSRCRSLCWITRRTQSLTKLECWRKTSASLRRAELMRMGKGYRSKRRGKRTMASH